jgi:predicted DCC family thiol-disulfide oxidoreductase YuxK
MSEPLRVFFDEECGLCSGALAWALARDLRSRLRPTPARSAEARRATGGLETARLLEELHTWSPAEGVRSGSDAVASMLVRLPGWAWAGRVLRLPLVRPVARRAYRVIARRRHRLGAALCRMPVAGSHGRE